MSTSPAFDREPEPSGGDQALVEQLRGLFREALNIEVPSRETDLIEAGLLDSLALVELLFEIEQRFAVDLALEELDIENFRTLDRLAAVIAEPESHAGDAAVSQRIRPLEREDISQVTGLYELVSRSGSPTPAPGLAELLRAHDARLSLGRSRHAFARLRGGGRRDHWVHRLPRAAVPAGRKADPASDMAGSSSHTRECGTRRSAPC